MKLSRRSLTLAATLSLAGCGGGGSREADTPESPGADWGPSLQIMPAVERYSFGALMSDGAVLMLTEIGVAPYQLVARRVEPGGHIGDLLTVASVFGNGSRSAFAQSSVVAASGDGAFVAWREYIPKPNNSGELQRLLVVRYRAQGGLQSPALLRAQPTGSIYPNFALAPLPANGAVIAWVESLPDDPDQDPIGPTTLYVASFTDSDGWSEPIRLAGHSPEQPIGIHDVAVGASPNGHVVVMWSQGTSNSGDSLMAVHCDPSGRWGDPALVFEGDAQQPADCLALGVAVDDMGNAMAVWEYFSFDQQVHRSGFNRWQASVGWLGAGTLSGFAVDPKVVMNSAGAGLITWGDNGQVLAVAFDQRGLGAVQVISTDTTVPAGPAVRPQATIDEHGYGVVAWDQVLYTNGEHFAARAARFTPTASWSSIATLSAPSEVAVLSHLTNTRDGRTAAIWNEGDISGVRSSFWLMPLAVKA